MLGFDAPWDAIAVFVAALAAGAANAIAGGGSAISFPVLVFVGVPPVAANATSGVGLWPGSASAAWSYRSRIRRMGRRTRWLLLPAAAGGLLGAWLLIRLPPEWFGAVAPFLVMGAALSVAVEPLIDRPLGADPIGESDATLRTGMIVMFAVAVYGGYFGAGMGLMMLTTLALLGIDDLQQANGIKNLLAVVLKLPAIAYFIAVGALRWDAALLMGAGALLGGWVAGHLIQKVDTRRLRWVITAVGLVLGAAMLGR